LDILFQIFIQFFLKGPFFELEMSLFEVEHTNAPWTLKYSSRKESSKILYKRNVKRTNTRISIHSKERNKQVYVSLRHVCISLFLKFTKQGIKNTLQILYPPMYQDEEYPPDFIQVNSRWLYVERFIFIFIFDTNEINSIARVKIHTN